MVSDRDDGGGEGRTMVEEEAVLMMTVVMRWGWRT